MAKHNGTAFRQWHEEAHSCSVDESCERRLEATAEAFELSQELVSKLLANNVNNEKGPEEEEEAPDVAVRRMVSQAFRSASALGDAALGDEPQPKELELLFCLDTTDQEATVRARATLLLTLWRLAKLHGDAWMLRMRLPLHKVGLMGSLRELNQGLPVQATEVTWVVDRCMSLHTSDAALERTKLLLCLAAWYSALPKPKGGLNRVLLMQRLQLERMLWSGMCSFVLWLTIFVTFAVAQITSSSVDFCRGIKGNLETQLALDEAEGVTAPRQIHAFAKELSGHLTAFAPLSETFFLGGHSWIIQDAPHTFTAPVRLPAVMEPEPNPEDVLPEALFFGRAFTLQAWVQLSDSRRFEPNDGLSLLTKSMATGRHCWSWRFPMQLRFGAHDYNAWKGANALGTHEEYALVNYGMGRELNGENVLHTLLVEEETATFMADTEVIGKVKLPRLVTDCESSNLTIGDAGLTLASVRFYPRRLTEKEVGQTFRAGLTWKEIGRMVKPQKMKEESVESSQGSTGAATFPEVEMAFANAVASIQGQDPPQPLTTYQGRSVEEGIDPVLKRKVWSIFTEPVFMSRSTKATVPGDAIPPSEKGFTISSWVKLEKAGYFMFLGMPLEKGGDFTGPADTHLCWSLYLGDGSTGFWVHGRRAENQRFHVTDDKSPWTLEGKKSYHHFAFSMDTEDDVTPYRICIDGECSGASPHIDDYLFSTEVGAAAANCMQTADGAIIPEGLAANETRLFLGHKPGEDGQMTGWQASTKYFDGVLSIAEVKKLFKEERLQLDEQTVDEQTVLHRYGCTPWKPDDGFFKDDFGHDCAWYYRAKATYPSICEGQEARRSCPMACFSALGCWGEGRRSEAHASLTIWAKQMDFRPVGEHGTMCVAKSTTAVKEAVKCGKRAPQGNCPENEDCRARDCSQHTEKSALVTCLGRSYSWHGSMPAFPCAAILTEEAPECAWDDAGLGKVLDVVRRTRTWSLSAWFENTGGLSCAMPSFRLVNSQGAVSVQLSAEADVRHEKSLGQWKAVCAPGAMKMIGSVNDFQAEFKYRASKLGEKRLLALSSMPGEIGQVLRLQMDEKSNENSDILGSNNASQEPVVDLRVINVLGTVRLSPLRLQAAALNGADFDNATLGRRSQEALMGASLPLRVQLTRRSKREVTGYKQKTMLVAPPFMLLRRRSERDCLRSWVIQAIHKQGLESQCEEPYTCDGYETSTVYKCPSGENAAGMYFGQLPLPFRGEEYYMEFLDTLTNNMVIVRQNDAGNGSSTRKTKDFVDVLTSEAQILALFYSVEFGIMTRLQMAFDTSQGRVRVQTSLTHSIVMQPEVQAQCLRYYGVCLLCLFMVMLCAGRSLRQIFKYKTGEAAAPPALDICLALLTTGTVVVLMVQLSSIGDEMDEMLHQLLEFDWEGPVGNNTDTIFQGMKTQFLSVMGAVDSQLFLQRQDVTVLATLLSMVLLVRVVYTTSTHPRMELITRTLELASSDLMHFLFLFGLVLGGFSLLGTWMFGQTREDFRHPWVALATLSDSILGPPGNISILENSTPGFTLYVVFFHMLCFLFLLNFVLAIIVDSYSRVMQEVTDCTVDQALPYDVFSVFLFRWRQLRSGFPLRGPVLGYLDSLRLKFVTVEDLKSIGIGDSVAEAFFRHYARYDFLKAGMGDGKEDLQAAVATLGEKLDVLLNREMLTERAESLPKPAGEVVPLKPAGEVVPLKQAPASGRV